MKTFTKQFLTVALCPFAFCILNLQLNCSAQSTRLWATYYGGTNTDWENDIITDVSGNVYLTGYTNSASSIASNGFQNSIGGSYDAFLVKFDGTGNRLWATYYGGTGSDFGYRIATDVSGNVYMAGATTGGSGIASGGFQNTYGGGSNDAFLVKFDANGNRLWATYYGGSGSDIGYGIALDVSGNIYLSGTTSSASGIASNGFQNIYGGGNVYGDAFLVKLDGNGNLIWATYYGVSSDDRGYSVATDASGDVYLAGYTDGSTGIASGGFQNIYGGGSTDAFLVKFNANGARLWATYYGGAGDELGGYYLATDVSENVYMVGWTPSTSGIASGGFQNIKGGDYDAYLVKFNDSGNRLWATYYGGAGYEEGIKVVTDISGNVYLSGDTYSTSGIAFGGFQNTNGGSYDAFLVKFDGNGNRQCATYYGGTGNDWPSDVATDGSGNVYLSGLTTSISGIASGGFQSTYGGGSYDAFLVKFTSCFNNISVIVTVTNILCFNQCTGAATVTPTNGTAPYTYTWSASGGQTTQTATGLCAGTYSVLVTDASGATVAASVAITQSTAITTSTTATPAACGNSNGTATVTASGGTPAYTYLWSNGNTTSSSWQLAVGSYSVLVTDANNCTQTATVAVTQSGGPTVSTSSTPQTCTQGGTATATASGGTAPYTYQWCNGDSTSATTGLSAGSCTIMVTDANGCSTIDTVTISSSGNVPVVNVTSIPASCNTNNGSATANVSGGTSPYTYLWSNGNTTSALGGLAVGNYSVLITDANNCTQTATASVTNSNGPTAIAGTTTSILSGGSASLNASGGATYSWAPSTGLNCTTCANPVASPTATIEYCVYVFDTAGCFDSACVTIFVVEPINCVGAGELFIPNAFSPNGDGENDVLKIYYGDLRCIETFKLVIYNRWGEKVFETTVPAAEWDGSFRGKIENTAVFVYYLEATFQNGNEIVRKGNISLTK